MQGITYRVQAVNPETFKTIEQVFTTSDAALRVRDYLRTKGYTAAVRPVSVNLTGGDLMARIIPLSSWLREAL